MLIWKNSSEKAPEKILKTSILMRFQKPNDLNELDVELGHQSEAVTHAMEKKKWTTGWLIY